ncbi:MAG: hypothetical protein KC561_04060 [Myxococcales bacterium]|nr:hypothetical protein [Myxococcales bacterium]
MPGQVETSLSEIDRLVVLQPAGANSDWCVVQLWLTRPAAPWSMYIERFGQALPSNRPHQPPGVSFAFDEWMVDYSWRAAKSRLLTLSLQFGPVEPTPQSTPLLLALHVYMK